MTNTPESDTMKTLTELSRENGADVTTTPKNPAPIITFYGDQQLLATFNAWSAQQEPIAYLRFYSHQYLVNPDVGMDVHEGYEVCEKTDLSADGTPAFAVHMSRSKPL